MKYLNIDNRFNWMKKSKFAMVVFASIALFVFNSCEEDTIQTVTNFETLVWQDEFSVDGTPDPTKWGYELGNGAAQGIPGWGNNELQYYTDRPENVVVENGMLKIIALQENYMGSGYTSARVTTEGLFKQAYGRFEARIKLPWGKGLWPAFWMLGTNSNTWPQRGEIDIMENRGDEPTISHGSIHGPGYSGGEPLTKSYELPSGRFDDDFHIFGVEWGPNYVNYYIDDVLYSQFTPADLEDGEEWVLNDNEAFLLLNVAVGGNFAGGFPGPNTVFPQTMYVDYVRVYSAD